MRIPALVMFRRKHLFCEVSDSPGPIDWLLFSWFIGEPEVKIQLIRCFPIYHPARSSNQKFSYAIEKFLTSRPGPLWLWAVAPFMSGAPFWISRSVFPNLFFCLQHPYSVLKYLAAPLASIICIKIREK